MPVLVIRKFDQISICCACDSITHIVSLSENVFIAEGRVALKRMI